MRTAQEFVAEFTTQPFKKIFPGEMRIFKSVVYHVPFELPALDRDAVYAGERLGTLKGNAFSPSLLLLSLLGKHTQFRTEVADKQAFLFTCGRDLFANGLSKRLSQHGYTLIIDNEGNVLGYAGMAKEKGKTLLKNLLDRGDFLRRERAHPTSSSQKIVIL